MHKVHVLDWGLIDYKEAWDRQQEIFDRIVQTKLAQRDQPDPELQDGYLIYCEHPHVYTLGKSGAAENLLADETRLREINASYYKINRGGDITYHGPGQLVMYPILDLDQVYTDIHRYLRDLEEAVIRVLATYEIEGKRYQGYTGVWIDPGTPRERKICAMGVKCSRWVTMHGIGFNVHSDLSYFDQIVPCGIEGKGVTSISKELGREISVAEVQVKMTEMMGNIFPIDIVKENLK